MSTKKPNPYDVEIGKHLRALRVRAEMSQEALGKAIGLTFQQVQKYEKGTNRLSGSRMVQIAKIFKVQPSAFFGANGDGKATVAVDPRLDTRVRHRLVQNLIKLDHTKLETVLLTLTEVWLDGK